ncbi:MAG TPA: glutamate--tRNA ligase [Steroidobacteraceae bacterium]|nr:glutamate--tRNA ligase [Steroidobacteraceae bacterium]
MSASPVVTRFAPSPSGELHLGNARTALFSALYARRHAGGRFLLRIEDTDRERSSEQHVAGLMADLEWLGLNWDAPVWRQSERGEFYGQALDQLEAAGKAYRCYCSPATLDASRKAQVAAGKPPRYAGTCRRLTVAERQAHADAGEPSTLRFAVPEQGAVRFDDLVHGPRVFACADIGDFILRRTDGTPSFFFSNALDDCESQVTQVLRGEDHLTNTPRQLLILAALGRPHPAYGHLSLLTGPDGAPLSKRHGATSVRELRERGFLAAAVVNHLFRLGHSTPVHGLLSLAEMAAAFEVAHLQRSPAHFDTAQLLSWQRDAVHASPEAVDRWLATVLPEGVEPGRRLAFIEAVRPNVVLPADALEWRDVVFGELGEPEPDAAAALAACDPALLAAAAQAAGDSAGESAIDFKAIAAAAKQATGASGAALYKPLRAALTGRLHGPELGPLLKAMSPGVAQRRLARFT